MPRPPRRARSCRGPTENDQVRSEKSYSHVVHFIRGPRNPSSGDGGGILVSEPVLPKPRDSHRGRTPQPRGRSSGPHSAATQPVREVCKKKPTPTPLIRSAALGGGKMIISVNSNLTFSCKIHFCVESNTV